MGIRMRVATEEDLAALQTVYADAVRTVGPSAYSEAQVQMWASFAADGVALRSWILNARMVVAEEEDDGGAPEIVGFCSLAADGHVNALYVMGDRVRQGIGSQLLAATLDHAQQQQMPRLYAEASEFSYPLFLKFGFEQTGTEVVDRHGVTFHRYLVAKNLMKCDMKCDSMKCDSA